MKISEGKQVIVTFETIDIEEFYVFWNSGIPWCKNHAMFTSYLIFETINIIKTGKFPLLLFLSLCHLYHYHSLKIYHCKRQGSHRNGKRKISVKWKILVRHTSFFFSPDRYSSASVEMVYNARTKVWFGTVIIINRKICFWHSHTIFGTWMYHYGTMCHIHSWTLSVLDFCPQYQNDIEHCEFVRARLSLLFDTAIPNLAHGYRHETRCCLHSWPLYDLDLWPIFGWRGYP